MKGISEEFDRTQLEGNLQQYAQDHLVSWDDAPDDAPDDALSQTRKLRIARPVRGKVTYARHQVGVKIMNVYIRGSTCR